MDEAGREASLGTQAAGTSGASCLSSLAAWKHQKLCQILLLAAQPESLQEVFNANRAPKEAHEVHHQPRCLRARHHGSVPRAKCRRSCCPSEAEAEEAPPMATGTEEPALRHETRAVQTTQACNSVPQQPVARSPAHATTLLRRKLPSEELV